MAEATITQILDDLRAAEEGLHRFERRYWLSSSDFYELYSQGLLDDGENLEDFAEWAGHYALRQKRLLALEQISQDRMQTLRRHVHGQMVRLTPAEPTLTLR
jgi:hypothetical protein